MSLRVCMLLHKSVVHDSRVRREAAALAEAGHDVTVVELDREACGRLDGFARVSAAPPRWIRRMLPFHLYRVAFLAAFLARVARLRPEVVHAHDAAMLLPGLIGARLIGARLVYDSHELATGVPYREGGWARFVAGIERLAVPRAAAVITVSDGIAERLQARYRLARRPVVVRNVCALPPAPPTGELRRSLGIGDAPLILHQGAPAPDRGCEVLVRAMRDVPGAHLVFLGDEGEPAFGAALERLAVEHGIRDRVHFSPGVPLEHLLARTAEADVGVSLLQDTCENHRLALPNKVFEYLTAGVPVVVSDLPELRRLVERHGVGWTVAPADAVAVAAGLRQALAARAEAPLKEALATAAAALSWSGERTRLQALYAGLDRTPSAVVLVRNTVTHDARVHREVDALHGLGFRTSVVGVVSDSAPTITSSVGVAAVTRLRPRSPMRRVRDRARAVRRRAEREGPPPQRVLAPSAQRTLPTALDRLHRTLTAADFYRQALSVVRIERPTLVHCNDWNTMWIGVGSRLLGACVVYDSHELWPDRNGRPEWRGWLLAAEALFVRVAHAVVTTSPGYAEVIGRRYRVEPPPVILNAPIGRVDGAAHVRPPGSPAVAIYVGGLLPGRGLEQAIGALVRVPEFRLELVGPSADSYRAELAACAREHGVSERVAICHPVSPEEVVATVACADVGLCLIQPVCLSYWLTLPNKLLEYAAAGLPILASDLPVIAELIRGWDAGEVVPPADLDAIARGLRRLVEAKRHRECGRGAAALANHCTWQRERQRLQDVYSAAFSGCRPRRAAH